MGTKQAKAGLKTIKADEFVRRIKADMDNDDDFRLTFFLGAGCSRSSGVPVSSELVTQHWLPRLKYRRTGSREDATEWAKTEIEGFDANNPGASYATVIDDLYPRPYQKQSEIERLVGNKNPGFGYATLAQLISHGKYGPKCNVILTTNFDDMVADALYLYTQKRPLLIHHESLAGFVKVSSSRPVCIKIHGDAHLPNAKHTEKDTKDLDPSIKEAMKNILCESGLVFLGYGGNDRSVASMLKQLPEGEPHWGVYWVNDVLPGQELRKWLEEVKAIWVQQKDFDEQMYFFYEQFGFERPSDKRFKQIFESYDKTQRELAERAKENPELQNAIKVEGDHFEFKNAFAAIMAANAEEKENPEKAQKIYEAATQKFPKDAALLGNFARFLHDIRKKFDQAEKYYQKALEAEPTHAIYLGNYAAFLHTIRKDFNRAEEYYKKALEADPTYAIALGNYAVLLKDIRKDFDKAEEYYLKALEADPTDATNLGNYAIFLKNIRKDFDQAEKYYKKALEADPTHATNLGNYALFLDDIRKDFDRAEEYYQKALQVDPTHATNLGNYAIFLKNIRKDFDQAEKYYKKALEADPTHATNLGNYALFSSDIRKDFDRAEKYYKKALKADPTYAIALGNYGGFLLQQGKHEGFDYVNRALEGDGEESLKLECHFYLYAHSEQPELREKNLQEVMTLLEKGVRSPGWDLSGNVQRAIEDGHPEPERLKLIAEIIAEKVPLEELQKLDS